MNNKNIQTEIDAAYLYGKLAANEPDINVAKVFAQMSSIEKSHALAFLHTINPASSLLPPPSRRAKIFNQIGKVFGYHYVLGVLINKEKIISGALLAAKRKRNGMLATGDIQDVNLLRCLMVNQSNVSGSAMKKFEERHHSVGGNTFQAAVLEGNNGLVCSFALVMGMAGATAGGHAVLSAGLAGLLAGALSMALGKWILVKSPEELFKRQLRLEMEEMGTNSEGEQRELALIYMANGIAASRAYQKAEGIMQGKAYAHEILVGEELGTKPKRLTGAAMEAALRSFLLFAFGAIIPVVPFMFTHGAPAIIISIAFSAAGLFLTGGAISLLTGKSVWYAGLRQVLFGLMAAVITFGIGKLMGMYVGG